MLTASAHAAGVAPVVVLTKADIVIDAPARLEQMQRRFSAQVPVFAVDALACEPAAVLAPWMGGAQTLILLG